MINDLYDLGLKKPSAILAQLKLKNIEVPLKSQLYNYLARLRTKQNGGKNNLSKRHSYAQHSHRFRMNFEDEDEEDLDEFLEFVELPNSCDSALDVSDGVGERDSARKDEKETSD